MTDGVSFTDHRGCAFGVRLGKDIFTNYPCNVACIARDMLQLGLISGAADPVFGMLTPVAVDVFIYFILRSIVGSLKPQGMCTACREV